MGKGYLEITIDREKAARYGVSVDDMQTEIEMALGGRVVTNTVEERDRFPVRVRYARACREDEEAVKRLLDRRRRRWPPRPDAGRRWSATRRSGHRRRTQGVAGPRRPRASGCIPLTAVADVRIVEGPAMIKSENGRLLNYVTLNVRGRDMVGFVEEAQAGRRPEGAAARGRPHRVEPASSSTRCGRPGRCGWCSRP